MLSSFENAVITWRQLCDMSKEDDHLWSSFEKSEIIILSHVPTCLSDVVSILEVLIDQSDARSDGKDQYALKSLKVFMERLDQIGLAASQGVVGRARMTAGSA